MRKSLLIFSFILSASLINGQTPGTLDSTFNGTGIAILQPGTLHDVVNGLAVQTDSKIVFCGVARMDSTISSYDLVVGRLNSDGTLDTTFANNGYYSLASTGGSVFGYAVKLQTEGKILVCGGYSVTAANTDFITVRLNSDGTPDTTYGNSNGISIIPVDTGEDYAYDLNIRDDGKIILAGASKVPGFTYNRGAVMRLLPDGSLDSTFGTQGKTLLHLNSTSSETFKCLDVTPGGKIITAGYSFQNLNESFIMAGFNENGLLDSSFATNGSFLGGLLTYAFDIVINGNSVYAGGRHSGSNGDDICIGCFDTLGVLNTSWGRIGYPGYTIYDYNPVDVCLALTVQSNGSLLAGGTTGQQGLFGDRDFFATRYTSAGALDSTFGTNGIFVHSVDIAFDDANAIALQSDGKILLGGVSSRTNNDMVIMRLNNNSSGVGISDLHPSTNWSICTSPVSGNEMFIKGTPKSFSILRVELIDITGRILMSKEIKTTTGTENTIHIDLPENLKTGVYFSRLTEGNSISTLPFTYQR